MTDRLIVAAAIGLLALAAVAMLSLHEKHYRTRRGRLLDAHLTGLEARVSAVESILREDRLT